MELITEKTPNQLKSSTFPDWISVSPGANEHSSSTSADERFVLQTMSPGDSMRLSFKEYYSCLFLQRGFLLFLILAHSSSVASLSLEHRHCCCCCYSVYFLDCSQVESEWKQIVFNAFWTNLTYARTNHYTRLCATNKRFVWPSSTSQRQTRMTFLESELATVFFIRFHFSIAQTQMPSTRSLPANLSISLCFALARLAFFILDAVSCCDTESALNIFAAVSVLSGSVRSVCIYYRIQSCI